MSKRTTTKRPRTKKFNLEKLVDAVMDDMSNRLEKQELISKLRDVSWSGYDAAMLRKVAKLIGLE